MKKVTINTLREMKAKGAKAAACTCYNYWQAQICDEVMDWILVGDSAANVEHGHKSTVNITMDEMISHAKAVCRGAKTPFIVGDMPFGSYEGDTYKALENAQRFIQAGCDCIKLEGPNWAAIRAIANSGILVFAHFGLTPQSQNQFGGYKIQRNIKEITDLVNSAAINGASLCLLEAIPNGSVTKIKEELLHCSAKANDILIYGIGAGLDGVDGQLVIFHDLMGLFQDFKPKFAKQYLDGAKFMKGALIKYAEEVDTGAFPSKEYCY